MYDGFFMQPPSKQAEAKLAQALISDPNDFMARIAMHPDWLSAEKAKYYDSIDPLNTTKNLFDLGEITPFAGHSLGPVLKSVIHRINDIYNLLRDGLHAGHFPDSGPAGNWFDCDIDPQSIEIAKKIFGFANNEEFVFTAAGLTTNLALLADTFYRPTALDWQGHKTNIALLATEFYSDQATYMGLAKRAIITAANYGCFSAKNPPPKPADLLFRLQPDKKTGLYNSEDIIAAIKDNAHKIKMLALSDIIFSTGQRLDLPYIFSALKSTIEEFDITVSLDLAHSAGNRLIDLKSLPVTFAVGCAYKHLSGGPGASLGIYVRATAEAKAKMKLLYPPIPGWKAAYSDKIFASIDHYDETIMYQSGALAFRTSNTSPVAVAPIQEYLRTFDKIGFDKLFSKSECLTQYLIAQLKHRLADKIQLVTPENPKERGSMIVFRVMGLADVKRIEHLLKEKIEGMEGRYEIDIRAPNIRITPHAGYISFSDVCRLVVKLEKVITLCLEDELEAASKMTFSARL